MNSSQLDSKRKKLRTLLAEQSISQKTVTKKGFDRSQLPEYAKQTYDQAMSSTSLRHTESVMFSKWLAAIEGDNAYSFEVPRLAQQVPVVPVRRHDGKEMKLLNFGSYNYLGYSTHPDVKQAAKDAIDQYGVGAASSPILSGTMQIHLQLEQALLDFYGLPDRGVSLFSSGYGVNLGAISSYVKKGHRVILDSACHVSILEGAQLSGANIQYFKHNDTKNLRVLLEKAEYTGIRTLVCTEGVFSADGDYGKLKEISAICKENQAALLVDEAHSILVAGQRGRGASEALGVLEDVDLICLTFSKGFGAIGGAVIAKKELTRYINWYAKCRMFSCALDPAATGALVKVLELVHLPDGDARRQRLHKNAQMLRDLLKDHVSLGASETWVVPVFYNHGDLTFVLNDFLQKRGLDTSIMQFPAVPINEARIRLFVTAEHTPQQLRECAQIIREAADYFGFLTK